MDELTQPAENTCAVSTLHFNSFLLQYDFKKAEMMSPSEGSLKSVPPRGGPSL